MPTPLHLLLLEDVAGDAELIIYELRRAGFDPLWVRVETEQEYIAYLHPDLDLILADYTLPQFNALTALQILKQRALDIPFIVVTGNVTEEVVAEVMREGAADYLLKDRPARLGQAVLHALEQKRLRDEKRKAFETLRRYNDELEATIRVRTTELMRALEREREINELKAHFVSMMSHEFRTPLAIIQSASDILSRYEHQLSPERKHEQLEEIRIQIKHLTTLLDDILTISRSQSVGLKTRLISVELEAFLAAHIQDMAPVLVNHVFEMTVSGEPRPVAIDTNLISQGIGNLLTNAVKFSPQQSRIRLDLIYEPDQIRLRVTDEGIGILDEDKERLFELFHRGRNAGNIQGTGLGLAIVKQIVDAHHGSVDIDSTLGQGTTMTITLPTRTTPGALPVSHPEFQGAPDVSASVDPS